MDHYTVRVITDPSDFREALDRDTVEYNNTDFYDKEKTYESFNETNGLMSIYIFDLHERVPTGEFDEKKNKIITKRKEEPVPDGLNACGPAIWFPKTKDFESSAVAYYVTKDYMEKNKIEEDSSDDD